MNKRTERLLAEMWRCGFIDAMQFRLITGHTRFPKEGGQA